MIPSIALRELLPGGQFLWTRDNPKMSKHDRSWYYISCHTPASCAETAAHKSGADPRSFMQISERTVSGFLNRSQVEWLNRSKKTQLQKIPKRHKDLTREFAGSPQSIVVSASPGCQLPFESQFVTPTVQIADVGANHSAVIGQLRHIQCVRAFELLEKPSLHVRYLRSYAHSSHTDYQIDSPAPYSIRSILNERGIDGSGQTAAIADTGIDPSLCWFRDIGTRLYVDNTQLDHRKIMAYMPYADSVDEDGGHGTFLAGIVAGKTFCEDPFAELCSGEFYDGVAPEARLFVQDIFKQNSSRIIFPSNISELVELPRMMTCCVQLNAWSFAHSHLLTHAVDSLAYQNPQMLLLFAAGDDNELRSPADGKNVLTVGAVYGTQLSLAQVEASPAVQVKVGNATMIGFCDRFAGVSLMDSVTREEILNSGFEFVVGDGIGDAHILQSTTEGHFAAGILLVFHSRPIAGPRLNRTVIRLPPKHSPYFREGTRFAVQPYINNRQSVIEDRRQTPYSHEAIVNFQRQKPEICMPGGPAFGPKAHAKGGETCGSDGVLIGEGTSVAAAFATGDILLIRQWLKHGWYPTGVADKHNRIKTSNHMLKAILKNIARADRDSHCPVPELDKFIIFPDLYRGGYGIRVFSPIELGAYSYRAFDVTLDASGTLKATLSWNDPPNDPIATNDVLFGVDLRVICPSETVYVGNRMMDDVENYDFHSTLKEVELEAEPGVYTVIVLTKSLYAYQNVQCSLVVSGPFDHFGDGVVREKKLLDIPCGVPCTGAAKCTKGWCECPPGRFGDGCANQLVQVGSNEVIESTNNMLEFSYYSYRLPWWNSTTRLSVSISSVNDRGFDYLFSVNKPPMFHRADCSSKKCEWAEVHPNGFVMEYKDWDFLVAGDFVCVGYYPTEEGETLFELRFLIN